VILVPVQSLVNASLSSASARYTNRPNPLIAASLRRVDTAIRMSSSPFKWRRKFPLGLVGSPDEIAKAVVFLASDDSSYITGIKLCVDGGMTQV
jgi:NAD(P)-dependent dehydrogenase (short-subunit alcohol dehydrogenase family)